MDRPRTGSRWWYLLLLVPLVGLLWTPFYAHPKPELFGFPFFYWYEFAWVPVTALITWFVYVRTRTVGPEPPEDFRRGAPFEPGPAPTPAERRETPSGGRA